MFLLFLLLAAADPQQAINLLEQGLISLQANRLAEARQSLETAAKLSPGNPYVWTSLADTYWRLNDKSKANQSALTAAKLRSGDPKVAHALAIFYAKAQDFKQAAAFEEEYARSHPADPNATSRAADFYLTAGDAAKALSLAKQAAEVNPSAANRNLLGRVYVARNDIPEALRELSEASRQNPSSEAFSFDYAQALLRHGDFSNAADALQPALEAHANNAQLTLAIGVARYGQRRFEDAISAFLKTIAIDPSLPQPYEFLGQMLDQAGPRLPEITKAYASWMRGEPDRFEPPLLLAKAQLASNTETAETEVILRKSIRLNAQEWESHFFLGELLEKRRDFKGAQQELEKSTALNPDQPMPHYHLARVFDRLGEPERAAAERDIHARLQAKPSSGMEPPTAPFQ